MFCTLCNIFFCLTFIFCFVCYVELDRGRADCIHKRTSPNKKSTKQIYKKYKKHYKTVQIKYKMYKKVQKHFCKNMLLHFVLRICIFVILVCDLQNYKKYEFAKKV